MIHYHGTRLSGDRLTTIRALKGRHAMVSFADPGDIEIPVEGVKLGLCAYRQRLARLAIQYHKRQF